MHTHFSHALQLSAATLQGELPTPVPRPVSALQAITLIYSNDSPAAKAGASTTLTVLVNNTDAPPSDLPLEGAHSHLLTMVHTIGGIGPGFQNRQRSAAIAGPLSQRGRQACTESTLMSSSRCHGRLPVRSSAFSCNEFTTNVGPKEPRKRRAQRPASKCARLNTESEKGLAADSALLGSGGTVTVLLGSASIGTAALSGAGRRRLLALTSTFSVTITVPAGTAAGSQVPCMQGVSHPML